jgi:dienelactone hydrolase
MTAPGSGGRGPRRWIEQRWLQDAVIEKVGLDWDQLRRGNTLGAAGLDAGADYDIVERSVTRFDEIGPAFASRGYHRLRRGREAEAAGDIVAAREHYFTSAAFFGWSQWPLHEEADARIPAWNDLKVEAFTGYARCSDRRVRRVELDLDGSLLPCWLHLPLHGEPPYPVVIVIPGMDTFKEIQIGLYGDKFLQRGFATLAVDGPGQSEALSAGLKLRPTNFADAAAVWLDWIADQEDLDEARVGVYGRSFGSYFTTVIAAHHSDRLKAAAGALVVHEPGLHSLLHEAAPSFRVRFQYMLGAADDEEMDELSRGFDLRGMAENVRCPFLAVAGELDQLSPTQHTVELLREMSGSRELVVYENERHAIGRSMAAKNGPNWHSYIAEWMRRRVIEGEPPEEVEARRLLVRSSGDVEVSGLEDITPGLRAEEGE